MKLTKKELQKIRENLKTGSQEEISTRTGLGAATVKAALYYPERYNALVIKTALELISEEKQRVADFKTKIKAI